MSVAIFYSLCWVTINHKPKLCSSILHLLQKDIIRVDKHYPSTACIYVWIKRVLNGHQVWHRLIYTMKKVTKGLQQNILFLSCCYHYNKNISSDMIGLAQNEHTSRTYRKTKIHCGRERTLILTNKNNLFFYNLLFCFIYNSVFW